MKSGEVRETLMKTLGDDVEEIFAGPEIIVHMKTKDAKLDEEALKAALAKHELKLKGDVKKDDAYIL
ncbi:hypothetical protein Poly30_18660 [Planctomycetes bacterium Poly30]|uniref:Uncharacterized protein n=1 Tax=Saltatorellus ferox TaxID=2528018 RepID=A0A518EQI9_9BACT|nr:hypothetical protein Poly30_18660 [Planctomycetes bacterium Poly30]